MKVYLSKFYLNGDQCGDTLVYCTKRGAMRRFEKLAERYRKADDFKFTTNNSEEQGSGWLALISYRNTDGDIAEWELTQQVTEDE